MPTKRDDILPPEMFEHVAARFRVLGDATRLAILRTLLGTSGGGDLEMNVGELVDELGSSQANISKHLRILHSAGIVARRPEGTAAYYSIADPSLAALCSIVCDRLRTQVREHARELSA